MTPETLQFLQWLIKRQTVNVGEDGAEEIARLAFQALTEVNSMIEPS